MATKVEILQELKRCEAYLKEKVPSLPSHLQGKETTVISTQKRIKELNDKLAELQLAEDDIIIAKQLRDSESLEVLLSFKDELYMTRERVREVWGSLTAATKAPLNDIERALSQMLRDHKPKDKDYYE